MRFAIILLVILTLACAVGSFITQGQSLEWYSQAYNERTAALIIALHLDDVFHSPWFIVITAFLCANLLLCNVLRLPQLVRQWKKEGSIDNALSGAVTASADGVASPDEIFKKLRLVPKSVTVGDGVAAMYAVKNRIGIWGAWVTHLGILLLILGFGLGQATHQEWVVYGVSGQTKTVEGTNYAVTIDDFRVELRDDDTVEQYTADITVHRMDADQIKSESGTISVNHPADFFGMRFYQNSTGWAANVTVLENGEELQKETVCAGEFLRVADKQELVVYFNAFYPDYVRTAGSMPATASSRLNNPAYLYSVYYNNEIIGMNVLTGDDTITIDDYEVIFSDPQTYTLIQVKRDSFQWLALLGGIVTTLGLVLSFYVQSQKVWAVRNEDGSWKVSGYSRKGGVIFKERFNAAAGITEKTEESENGTA